MHTNISLRILLIVNCLQTFGENVDYCNKSLCKRSGKHIACGNNGEIDSICASYSEVIELTPEMKANISRKHNEHRNRLALGQVPYFESASRMGTMQWNDELARMADLNVKSCTGTHDSCRNTYSFPHSGQNIARRTTQDDSITAEQLAYNIYRGIDRWFQENAICPIDGTTVYTSSKKKCGHFTIMAIERNVYLGCAVMHMKRKKTVFTCNYAWTNMRNKQLYSPGKASSDCMTGRNEQYPGLCSINEKYA